MESRYTLKGDGSYGFALGSYDPRYPLVIDPGPDYSTFLGGTDFDDGEGIAVDQDASAYVTGITESADYPTTPVAFDSTLDGGFDVFVTKLDTSGSALAHSTYLAGTDAEVGSEVSNGIAVDGTGRAYVTGWTDSADYPTTSGAFNTTNSGGADAFVTKLPTG